MVRSSVTIKWCNSCSRDALIYTAVFEIRGPSCMQYSSCRNVMALYSCVIFLLCFLLLFFWSLTFMVWEGLMSWGCPLNIYPISWSNLPDFWHLAQMGSTQSPALSGVLELLLFALNFICILLCSHWALWVFCSSAQSDHSLVCGSHPHSHNWQVTSNKIPN